MTSEILADPPIRRRYRGASPAERQAARCRKLIEAGLALFGTAGYANSPVKSICGEAGLTERYFYESFANREELFAALYEHVVQEIGVLMVNALEAVPEDADLRARALLEAYFGKIEADRAFARVLLLEVLGVSEYVHQTYLDAMARFTGLVERHVRPAFVDEARMQRESIVAAGLVGAIVHVAMRWVISDYATPRDQVIEGLMTIFTATAARDRGL